MRLISQVYNIKQAKRDIDAVYSMGLFDDVNILPSPAEDTTIENPKARLILLSESCPNRYLTCTLPLKQIPLFCIYSLTNHTSLKRWHSGMTPLLRAWRSAWHTK